MRGKIFGRFFPRTLSSLAVAAALIAVPVPIRAFADEPSPPGDEQKQSEQDRCKFLMDKVSAIILSLNPEGKITFSITMAKAISDIRPRRSAANRCSAH